MTKVTDINLDRYPRVYQHPASPDPSFWQARRALGAGSFAAAPMPAYLVSGDKTVRCCTLVTQPVRQLSWQTLLSHLGPVSVLFESEEELQAAGFELKLPEDD